MAGMKLTDQNFDQEVLKSEAPVLVDFWAAWCGPCKMQAPIIEELRKEFEGKAKVGGVEVDENPKTAQQYGIMSIPTLAIFKEGKIVWQATGVQEKGTLAGELNKVLG